MLISSKSFLETTPDPWGKSELSMSYHGWVRCFMIAKNVVTQRNDRYWLDSKPTTRKVNMDKQLPDARQELLIIE